MTSTKGTANVSSVKSRPSTLEDGRRAILLNNYRFAYTAWPTVEFDVPIALVQEVDQQTGQAVPVYDDSPEMPGLQVSLDASEGRLFLLPANTGTQ